MRRVFKRVRIALIVLGIAFVALFAASLNSVWTAYSKRDWDAAVATILDHRVQVRSAGEDGPEYVAEVRLGWESGSTRFESKDWVPMQSFGASGEATAYLTAQAAVGTALDISINPKDANDILFGYFTWEDILYKRAPYFGVVFLVFLYMVATAWFEVLGLERELSATPGSHLWEQSATESFVLDGGLPLFVQTKGNPIPALVAFLVMVFAGTSSGYSVSESWTETGGFVLFLLALFGVVRHFMREYVSISVLRCEEHRLRVITMCLGSRVHANAIGRGKPSDYEVTTHAGEYGQSYVVEFQPPAGDRLLSVSDEVVATRVVDELQKWADARDGGD